MEYKVGYRSGKLVITEFLSEKKVICKCDCGGTFTTYVSQLEKTKSCGCIGRDRKQRKSKTRLYSIYNNMKRRCNEKQNPAYNYYGGRGIRVCDEWMRSYDSFMNWALSHGYTDTLTIERIDVNGNYEPSNCKWIPFPEQKNNTRKSVWVELNGERKTLKTWADEYKIPYTTLLMRVRRGVDPKLAITAEINGLWKHTDDERGKKRITRAKRVIQYTKDGEYIKAYESAREAAKAMNGGIKHSENSITNCCRGRSKSSFGYVWRYE